MKGYLGLANRNLIRHKKNTLVCIIGIMIGAIIMTTTSIIYNAERNTFSDTLKSAIGLYDIKFVDLNKDQVEKLKHDGRLSNTALYKQIGVSEMHTESGGKKCYNVLALSDDAYKNVFKLDIILGRIPENGNEILVDSSVITTIKGNIRIGDNIDIDVMSGQVDVDDLNFVNEYKTNPIPYKMQSIIEKREKKTYKVVGIFQSSEEYKYQATNMFTKLNDEDIKSMSKLDLFASVKITGIEGSVANDLGIRYGAKTMFTPLPQGYIKSQVKFINTDGAKIDGSIGILGGILVMSIVLIFVFGIIYNAFNISIAERLKQFGMLRAIGAKRSQIGVIIFYEAIVEYIIGIILGVTLGLINTKVLLAIFEKVFKLDFSYIKVGLDFYKIIFILLTMLIIVMLAAYRALFKDIKLSPIQSMNEGILLDTAQITSIENNKKINRINKIFNIEGELSYKNLSRNRIRNKTCLKSIAISMILIMFFFGQMSFYKIQENNIMPSNNWDIKYSKFNKPILDKDISNLKSISGVENVYTDRIISIGLPMEKNKINNEILAGIKSFSETLGFPKSEYKNYCILKTLFRSVDENTLNAYKDNLKVGELNYSKLKEDGIILVSSGTSKVAINRGATGIEYMFNDVEKVVDVKVGDKVRIPLREKFTSGDDMSRYFNSGEVYTSKFKEFTVVGIVNKDSLLDAINDKDVENLTREQLTFITANEAFLKNNVNGSNEIDIKTNASGDREKTVNSIREYAASNYDRYTDFYAKKVKFKEDTNKSLCWDINFEINILIIVIINIINTFNANILVRRKELGALRAIGTTQKQLDKMLLLETVFLALTASGFGLVLGALPAYLSQMSMKNLNKNTHVIFAIIIPLTIIAAIIICILSTIHPIRKLKNFSIVDNIRNEE
ncbi:MacB-like core domain-containing protein [Clostridium cavendishii DSM 21758]|uniref:MacB-like core domain-containing protein n=1 Tax=Clostridium cavendishii DSM 21758 TaxID=1121302 RepID=A0A1M6J8B8_9CLOT|nr:ABC transporter permease [Clostridium cavendishii]SHJ42882.1 MacB-like core domain-containing protein [Clostridium cavendishii DSM 21758]